MVKDGQLYTWKGTKWIKMAYVSICDNFGGDTFPICCCDHLFARAWGLLFNPAFRGTRVPFEFKLDKTHSKHMYFRRGGIHSNLPESFIVLHPKRSTHSHTYIYDMHLSHQRSLCTLHPIVFFLRHQQKART